MRDTERQERRRLWAQPGPSFKMSRLAQAAAFRSLKTDRWTEVEVHPFYSLSILCQPLTRRSLRWTQSVSQDWTEDARVGTP
jgi:hypothetical protein